MFNEYCEEVGARIRGSSPNSANSPALAEGELLLSSGELRGAKGEKGEERLLAYPLVGFRTLDELAGCPAVCERVRAVFERLGLKTEVMRAYPAFVSGGQVRRVFVPVEDLRVGLVNHEELGEQLLSTPFEVCEERVQMREVGALDLNKEAESEQFWSLVLDFRLGAAAYASEVAGSVLGAPVSVERQKAFVGELEGLYGESE